MGPPRSAKSVRKLSAPSRVSKNFCGVAAVVVTTTQRINRQVTEALLRQLPDHGELGQSPLSPYRIRLLLVGAVLPRVTNRTTTAITRMTASAIAIFIGVKSPGLSGAGV